MVGQGAPTFRVICVTPCARAAWLNRHSPSHVRSNRRYLRRPEGACPRKQTDHWGIVALRAVWKNGVASDAGRKNITKHTDARHLDLGLALNDVAFDYVPVSTTSELLTPGLTFSEPGVQLISFAMRLFRRLQATGTALAVDLNVYEESLESITVADYADIDRD